ncbi:hypothetical protein PTKU64_88950 [Paraburkholderia terrae]|uniref:Uncharacterized protein n=1 Tax=Paraburkholderia terrae TaxID=311230 RepID=A0ABN6JW87_9BURK|nr:hypothetical protein PTKU64_88950 [Paraburkholderia terrae]
MVVDMVGPEVNEPAGSVDQDIAGAFAECDHLGIGLEEQPLIQRWASIKHDAARKLWAERFEPVSAARADERERLARVRRMFHKISSLRTGFEV